MHLGCEMCCFNLLIFNPFFPLENMGLCNHGPWPGRRRRSGRPERIGELD